MANKLRIPVEYIFAAILLAFALVQVWESRTASVALDYSDFKLLVQAERILEARILRLHARRLTLGTDVDLAAVAAKTPGFAGADLANIVNEAALHAARENNSEVAVVDFDAAIDRAIAGLEKKSHVMNPKEKDTVAYHEAGHALIAELRATTDKVSRVSIIPRGIGALGFTQQLPTEDRYLMKRGELLDRLDVFLGGRDTLTARKRELEALAKLLLKHETVDRETLLKVLAECADDTLRLRQPTAPAAA